MLEYKIVDMNHLIIMILQFVYELHNVYEILRKYFVRKIHIILRIILFKKIELN